MHQSPPFEPQRGIKSATFWGLRSRSNQLNHLAGALFSFLEDLYTCQRDRERIYSDELSKVRALGKGKEIASL